MPTKNQAKRDAPKPGRDGMVRLRFTPTIKAAEPTEAQPDVSRSVEVLASTADLDRHGSIVVQDFDLASYAKVPTVLWNHGMGSSFWGDSDDTDLSLPIGYASDTVIAPEGLRSVLTLVDEKANPLAEKVFQGVKQKSIRAVSIGFWPHEVRVERHNDQDVWVLSKNELLEISFCAIPANPNAVAEERASTLAFIKSLAARGGARTKSVARRAISQPVTKNEGSKTMDKIAEQLGLSADASEDDILAAIKALQEKAAADAEAEKALRSLLTLTGKKSAGEAVACATGWKSAADEHTKLATDVAEMKATQREAEVKSILDEGERAGKVPPAKRAWCLEISGADKEGKGADPAKLRSLVGGLPVIAAKSHTETPPNDAAAQELGAMTPELDAASKQLGVTPEQMKKSREKRAKRAS